MFLFSLPLKLPVPFLAHLCVCLSLSLFLFLPLIVFCHNLIIRHKAAPPKRWSTTRSSFWSPLALGSWGKLKAISWLTVCTNVLDVSSFSENSSGLQLPSSVLSSLFSSGWALARAPDFTAAVYFDFVVLSFPHWWLLKQIVRHDSFSIYVFLLRSLPLSHVRPQNIFMRFSPHPLPFLFDAESRTTRIIAWEIAQLSTLAKMGTYDSLLVNPRGKTGSRRISKNNLRGVTMGRGPIWGITSLTSS